MFHYFLLCIKMSQPYIYIYPLPSGLPFRSGHRSALSRVPCAAHDVLMSYHFKHGINSVYMCQSQSLNLSHPYFLPWYSYICPLCLCIYFFFANKFIYTIRFVQYLI